jgi:hypothetical protein
MDMSKLPRMSQTPPPPEPSEPDGAVRAAHARPAAAAAPPLDYREAGAYEPAPSVAEAWISIAIGLILLFIYPYFWQWLISLVSNYKPPFLPITDSSGAQVPYAQSIFFFSNLCVFAFALVLVIDGLILFTRRPALLMFAFGFTVITAAMNFLCIVNETMHGRGFPIASALAFAFGVYIAIFQWKLLQAHRMFRQRGA